MTNYLCGQAPRAACQRTVVAHSNGLYSVAAVNSNVDLPLDRGGYKGFEFLVV